MKTRLQNFKPILAYLFAVSYIPWNQHWEQSRTHFKDLSKVEVILSKDCSKPNPSDLKFSTEVASTPKSKEKGLGFRHSPLRPNTGMIFVFDPAIQAQFWMKETYIPLQLAYFNTNSELFQLEEMAVEKNPHDPEKLFPAQDLVSAALEVNPKTIKSNQLGMKLCVKSQ